MNELFARICMMCHSEADPPARKQASRNAIGSARCDFPKKGAECSFPFFLFSFFPSFLTDGTAVGKRQIPRRRVGERGSFEISNTHPRPSTSQSILNRRRGRLAMGWVG